VGSAAKRAAQLFAPSEIALVEDRAAADMAWVAQLGPVSDTELPPKPYLVYGMGVGSAQERYASPSPFKDCRYFVAALSHKGRGRNS
jgi:hypothetical protein